MPRISGPPSPQQALGPDPASLGQLLDRDQSFDGTNPLNDAQEFFSAGLREARVEAAGKKACKREPSRVQEGREKRVSSFAPGK